MSNSTLAALNGLATGGPDLTVQFEDHTEPTWMTASSGELRAGRGTHGRPDIWLRGRYRPALQMLAEPGVPWRAAEGLSAHTSHTVPAPCPPFDVAIGDGLGRRVPGATLTVQHVSVDSPVGNIRFIDRFEDGRLVSRSGGVADRWDAIIENGFASRMRAFEPGSTVQDSATTARIGTSGVSTLLLLGGLYDSMELRRHFMTRSVLNGYLVALAQHTRSEVWLGMFHSDPLHDE